MSANLAEPPGADAEREAGALKELAQRILDEARRQGATAAEVGAGEDTGLSVTVRKGELETVEFAKDRGFGITVYAGERKGHANTSDDSADAIADTVRAALNIARYTAADPCNGLAEPALMATAIPELDIHYPRPLDARAATGHAEEAEAAALAYDARVVNSEGATVAAHRGCHVYGNSHGFLEATASTRYSTSCSVIAEDSQGMQRDGWYTVGCDAEDLEPAAAVGERAARRAIGRLGHRPIATGAYPVLFAPPMAVGLIGHLLSAISGAALYRRASYLVDSLGQTVAAPGITLAEQPHRRKGLGSAAHDGDGVATRAKAFVAGGVVENYVLGTYSARRLGLATTGNAGGVFNLDLIAKTETVQALTARMGTGLLVSSLMGQGVNLVTGDYSRAAAGVWIENGEPQHPVDEVTIATNLDRLFKGIIGCGDDVDRRGNIQCGSLLVEEMTVAT